jgi:peroxiredoxin Q/BCP
MSLEVGDRAPDFSLETDKGETFKLSVHRGHPVVLFFYPEDDTDGCTIENIEFTDEMPDFEALGATVIGISPDSVEKHCKFRDKYRLGVTLASDPKHVAIKKYDVWGPKKLFGVHYDGLIRTTFLVGPNGKIAGTWLVTRIKGHAATVLAATKELVTA